MDSTGVAHILDILSNKLDILPQKLDILPLYTPIA